MHRPKLILCLLVALVLRTLGVLHALEVDQAMEQDPLLRTQTPARVFSPRYRELWSWALQQGEDQAAMQAALAMAQAHTRGMADFSDQSQPLQRKLESPDAPLAMRLAIARALIDLEARDAADALARAAQDSGIDMALLVEPALARWGHAPQRQVWLDRVEDRRASRALRLTAIAALATVNEPRGADPLLRLAQDTAGDEGVRLEAARALSALTRQELVEPAASLARSSKVIDRLVAAWMLAGHDDPPAQGLMLQLCRDDAPVVAAVAIQSLLRIDPLLLEPHGQALTRNDDANVRRLIARAITAQRTPQAVDLLATLLDDRHPEVRTAVRDHLLELAQLEPLATPVRLAGQRVLETQSWRGLEQAALLLGELDHEPAAPRLLELLDFERSEVCVTAAWALRKLAVDAVLPEMLAHVQEGIQTRLAARGTSDASLTPKQALALAREEGKADRRLSQLIQAMGLQRYTAAQETLLRLVPKNPRLGVESRGAAVWALGLQLEGQASHSLVRTFAERLADINPLNPEAELVRRMSAVSIGRMRGQAGLSTLRAFAKDEGVTSMVGVACLWAIERITGQPVPAAPLAPIQESGFFLEPLD